MVFRGQRFCRMWGIGIGALGGVRVWALVGLFLVLGAFRPFAPEADR